jgi:protein-disulfide isomerase
MNTGFALGVLAGTMAASAQQLPVEGKASSPVQVVIYEDLQCSDCAALRRMMDEKLLPKYGGAVAFVHRDFPLAKHAWARRAALASRYFATVKPELALAWRRHILFTRRQTTDANFNEILGEFATANGANASDAVAALDNAAFAAAVEKDFQEGVARGVSRTPTAFVNGVPFIESFTLEEISKGIDQALAETK